jgi:hypothetical protein
MSVETIRRAALEEAEAAVLAVPATSKEWDLPAGHYAGVIHDLYEPGLDCDCCCVECQKREPAWKMRERKRAEAEALMRDSR